MGWTQSLERLGESLEKASDREIVISRVFDAPRDLVFQAWTDPKHVGSWWGPTGFTTTTHEIDVRPGGVWRFIMHGPDGTDYPNKIVYLEIAKPALLVYDHGDEGQRSFRVTVTFAEESGKTRLTMRSLFATAAEREMVVTKYHAIEGGNQTLDRFGEHLAKTIPNQ
ncbi:MAG: SRPBCC family protein [Acidobacteriia bacterium]|nr:SRPBCC family protein [Terriglobia bacterium]